MSNLKTILAAIPLPEPAVYSRAIGTVGASMYTYTAEQLRADREAVALAVARDCIKFVESQGSRYRARTQLAPRARCPMAHL